ncbi:anti-sigma factor [Marinoscillum furvescens]|uniref:Anti-sigma-K factor RskA n=1 Tax=Marinoscillum furvescens DSM 4134 TaxID=1122208 RepID=A0A3D9LKK3_MARFU|nr:anti-sigma factor [Marinoscillum furvescens]REE05782.1 anti-sigma-K factor RskA [Marinoscillum furvescens DSM 4134]
MNREEIITEGYLAAYITGELSAEQLAEVEQFIQDDEQVGDEFYELQKTVEQLAFQYAITPATAVKRFIMEDPKVMTMSMPTASGDRVGNGIKMLLAASVVVTLLSAFAAVYFWNQWKNTDYRLAQLTARNLELAESYHIVNQELTDIRQDLAVLVSPEFSRIILNGTDNAKDAKAVIYWNPDQEEVYLNSANLASLPQNQQYQLWALIDGVPVDAGVFDANEGTFQIMKNIAKADAFAVTVEESGGAASPTLETMQVYGEPQS